MFLITSAIFWCGREHERSAYCIILTLSLHYQTDSYILRLTLLMSLGN